jgi:hypothetical protein
LICGVVGMAAANDNRNAAQKRARAQAARSLATMKRIIHEIYGSEDTKQAQSRGPPSIRIKFLSHAAFDVSPCPAVTSCP